MHTYIYIYIYLYMCVGRIAQSVERLATGWTVRGSNPGRGEIFRTCPDRPWGPPSLLYNGYRVFPGGKERQGRDADPSPPSSAVGHERVELYLYSHLGLRGLLYGELCLYLYLFTVGQIAQSVQRLARGWTVRGSNPGESEIFRTCPDRLWGPPSLLYNG